MYQRTIKYLSARNYRYASCVSESKNMYKKIMTGHFCKIIKYMKQRLLFYNISIIDKSIVFGKCITLCCIDFHIVSVVPTGTYLDTVTIICNKDLFMNFTYDNVDESLRLNTDKVLLRN